MSDKTQEMLLLNYEDLKKDMFLPPSARVSIAVEDLRRLESLASEHVKCLTGAPSVDPQLVQIFCALIASGKMDFLYIDESTARKALSIFNALKRVGNGEA